MSLRERILEYLSKYPSVGLYRLTLDLAPPDLQPSSSEWARRVEEVKKAVLELERLGLVVYGKDLEVVNLSAYLETGWGYAGGRPPWIAATERKGEAAAAVPETTAIVRGERRGRARKGALDEYLGGG